MAVETLPHVVDGVRVQDPGTTQRTNINPATGEQIAKAPLDAVGAAEKAVASALRAFPDWAATPVGDRVQHLFKYKNILEANAGELAEIVVKEHGKTFGEAMGSVRRGIDCIEHACAAPVLMMGRTLPQIAVSSSFCRTDNEGGVGIDSSVDRVPVGVTVGITPFNFPVMVPMWMWPMAVACGNTFVLKPSEKDPASTIREDGAGAREAGLPPGRAERGARRASKVVDHLLAHDDVRGGLLSSDRRKRGRASIYKTGARRTANACPVHVRGEELLDHHA